MRNQMAFQKREIRTKVDGDRRPGIGERKLRESDVKFLIDYEGRIINNVEETFKGGFKFGGVSNFTFNGWTGHLGVIIGWLVGKRPRESRLQTNIGSGRADGFGNTMSGRNIFGTRGMGGARSGARRRPILLNTKGSESEGSDKVLRGKRDRVGTIAIIRRVDNEGYAIHQHFMNIEDNTGVSVTTERVPFRNRRSIRGGGRKDFNRRRGGT